MKRIALLVLALAANAIADEKELLQQIAEDFETDVSTVKECVNKAGMTIKDTDLASQKWDETKNGEKIDNETKESIMRYGRFIVCILENKDMMKNSKLVLDKILEGTEDEQNASEVVSKEVITECVKSLNRNDKLTEEERALEFIICIIPQEQTKDKK
ncbi:uncharacterized protein [Anoplolepis gracilipes]|uniref:uncharacterized protein n=1 Tax=Anoplolepis gracilipes TaxID=354296 RepID=UPI003BA13467